MYRTGGVTLSQQGNKERRYFFTLMLRSRGKKSFAKKVFYLFCPYFPLRRKNHFAELMQKKNAAISKKITTLPKIHIQFCRTFLFVLFFDF